MSLRDVRAFFGEQFGGEPEVLGVAPGRINLIGEHTDYNEGFVFPVAIDREVWIAARKTDGETRVVSKELGEGQSFQAGDPLPGEIEGWAVYPAGMAWALKQHGFSRVPDLEAAVVGEVPIGAGISSSAAIEMAFGVVWNKLGNLALSMPELAKIGQVCENRFVGVNSGIMDQMASALGKAGHAMFLDTRSLEVTYAPLPSDLKIVLCDTGKPRALTESAYNERRMQCEEAARLLGVPTLRDIDEEEFLEKQHILPETLCRRARHVVTENRRCLAFVTALREGIHDSLGKLMKASHESLRDDYEVSCPELDAMAGAAWQSEGCIGARMTGAGFGGACVALVKRGSVDAFIAEVASSYEERSGMSGSFLPCEAVDGARTL